MTTMGMFMRRVRPLVAAALLALAGCGVLAARRTSFPASETTATGQTLTVEDIEAIVNDTLMTDDEKRQALRDLGIEDDILIEALLTL